MNSYHFSLGNSTEGSIGFCARVEAEMPEQAVELLKGRLPSAWSVTDDRCGADDEYIEIYFNPEAITVADIDEAQDENGDEIDLTEVAKAS